MKASNCRTRREPGQTVTAEYLERGALRYSAEDGDIVGRNGTDFNNRPLYCETGTEGVVLAGDRPLVRLLAEPFVLGAFCAAVVRAGTGILLHACAEVEARYRCGRMTWRIRDASLPGALVVLHVAPMKGAAGFVLRLEALGLAAGDPAILLLSTEAGLPMVCGELDLSPEKDQVFWAVEAMTADGQPGPRLASPASAYAEALADLEATERVRSRTPEPRLDAALGAVCHAIDGACDRDPFRFRHGCMAWSCHFLGWRVICGATALAWHDRVKGTAAHYLATQSMDDPVRTGSCRDDGLGCVEGSLSRLFGRGRIEPEKTSSYDMQSQFFDQLLREWRWTADPELERMLAPALDLHPVHRRRPRALAGSAGSAAGCARRRGRDPRVPGRKARAFPGTG